MASGDIVMLTQEAGNGNTFTFTTTVDLVIMGWGFESIGNVGLGTFVASTSGISFLLRDPSAASPIAGPKPVIPSGSVLTKTNVDVNVYGIQINCIEL
jgi:hypothetical protein